MPGLTRQDEVVVTSEEPEVVAPVPLGTPLGSSSLERFGEVLESLKKGVDQGSEIALLVVDFLYNSNNATANKILTKYRTNCNFRKSVRNASLDILNNAGLLYSLNRDQSCINNLDRAFIVSALASLGVNTAMAISEYRKVD
jgi:hypothetical protein